MNGYVRNAMKYIATDGYLMFLIFFQYEQHTELLVQVPVWRRGSQGCSLQQSGCWGRARTMPDGKRGRPEGGSTVPAMKHISEIWIKYNCVPPRQ